MGHVVNSIAFRLDYIKKWASVWTVVKGLYKKYLHLDFNIFIFLKSFFIHYTTPNFSYTNLRNNTKEKEKASSGLSNIIPNQFIENIFFFSHVSVSRDTTLEVCSYFLDGLLDTWRLDSNKQLSNFPSLIFHPMSIRKRRPLLMSDYKNLSKLFGKRLGLVKYKFKSIFSKIKLTRKKKKVFFNFFNKLTNKANKKRSNKKRKIN